MLPIEQLEKLIQGKKVAFIGAGVSHKRCIEQFVELGAQVTLCDQKKSIEDFGDYADTLRRLNVALSLGEHYTDGFAGQDIIMRTPGYEYFKPELQAAQGRWRYGHQRGGAFLRVLPLRDRGCDRLRRQDHHYYADFQNV